MLVIRDMVRERVRDRLDVVREMASVARQGILIPQLRRSLRVEGESEQLVVFVHGYFASAGVWNPLSDHLVARGVAPRQLHFNYAPTGSIEVHARRLARAIAAAQPRGPVCVVAHSLGGLIARWYIQLLGGRVDALVAMGTPHRGTVKARGWPLNLARELSPGSSPLCALEATRHRLARTAVTCVVGGIDLLVDPVSASLEGAAQVMLPEIGHHGLIYHPAAWSAVVDAVSTRAVRDSGTYPTFRDDAPVPHATARPR